MGFEIYNPEPKQKKPHIYTPAQAAFIAENIKGRSIEELTKLFNKRFKEKLKISQIRGFTHNHGLTSGLDKRFKPGHIPANKGKKGTGGWPPTQFRKGHVPATYRPVGSERVNVYGYVEVKVEDPKKWRMKHAVIWEEHNGPVPKGHVVIFGDGNRRNFDPNNLILVSNAQLAILNKKHLIQNDANLTRTGIIVVDICRKISERKKTEKNICQY